MKKIILFLLALIVIVGVTFSINRLVAYQQTQIDKPWDHVKKRPDNIDHSHLIRGPFEDGPSVTRECLECHEDAAENFMKTTHWTWLADEADCPHFGRKVQIGKKNLINNFCISVESNWPRCTSCHAGYGWKDETFDFSDQTKVDCLICHDQSGTYDKEPTGAGLPREEVDLLAVAKSVGLPNRENCGYCHFKGGGGDAVKHGDMDGTMYFPSERIDVHMGKHNLACLDCHRTEDHQIKGRSMSVSVDLQNRIYCTDCHIQKPHAQDRLNSHVDAVACQTCHIPKMAIDTPTKMDWDWSTAGHDREEDIHHYLKTKGSFVYAQNIDPEYFWYNGCADRYLKQDKINPYGYTNINDPAGTINDSRAKIWPFKVFTAKQLYDVKNEYLLVPKLFGPGGYWKTFDWNQAAKLGSEASGLEYSGEFGFTDTIMYWPLSHMVQPKDKALQCIDCHGEDGRMDWEALGYDGDPAFRGGRLVNDSNEYKTGSRS